LITVQLTIYFIGAYSKKKTKEKEKDYSIDIMKIQTCQGTLGKEMDGFP
jgi:hypothetical protein